MQCITKRDHDHDKEISIIKNFHIIYLETYLKHHIPKKKKIKAQIKEKELRKSKKW